MIPYSQGAILLADRQNTFENSWSKQERLKILLLSPNGPVLGCAGDSQFIENLFATLKDEWTTLQSDSYSRFKSVYTKLSEEAADANRFAGAGMNPLIETVLVEVQGGRVLAFSAMGPARKTIDCRNLAAIPMDFPEIQQYLRIDSKSLSDKEAIDLGEQILRQMCFLNYKIGAPEYHGYDFVKITNAGAFTSTNVAPKISRLDPSQLIDKVRIEEAV